MKWTLGLTALRIQGKGGSHDRNYATRIRERRGVGAAGI
jgi:hypothetical protein